MDDRGASPRWALDYPYEQPRRSYLQLGEQTLELPAEGLDLAGRGALLAYGANAAPLALSRKLAGLPAAPLPMLRARLAGFDVVYSNHVSPYGAVPGTLHPSPGTTVTAFVAYPDEEQLRALTATEPNYELATLAGLDCRLEDGSRLEGLDAYLSRHGPWLLDGFPAALAEVDASGRRFEQLTQRQIQRRVARPR
jgi:hypothetical protein